MAGDFIGDGMMVFWNSPDVVRDHASKACECALRMHKALEELNLKWMARGFPEIQSRIGINSGDALSGNIGSPYKMKVEAEQRTLSVFLFQYLLTHHMLLCPRSSALLEIQVSRSLTWTPCLLKFLLRPDVLRSLIPVTSKPCE